MVFEQITTTGQETKDNLGAPDTTKNNLILFNKESINIEENPTIIETRTIGTAFILGHPDNGILGTSALGAGTIGSWTVQRVTNPLKIWHEHFRDAQFQDTTNSLDLNWDTTNFRAEGVTNSRLQSTPIFLNNTVINAVKIVANTSGLKLTFNIDKTANPGGVRQNLT